MAQELPSLTVRLEQISSRTAELAQSRNRIQSQLTALEQEETKLGQQAAVARRMGREDLALRAEARGQEAESQRAALAAELAALLNEEAELTISAQRLRARKARIYWFGLQGQDGEDTGAS